MKYLFTLLLAVIALVISGCASMDNSMASDATDIPDEKPLSEQKPVLTNPSPSPGSTQPVTTDQGSTDSQ